MLYINYSYTYGVEFPILFRNSKVGDDVIHHGGETGKIISIEDEYHFIVKWDNKNLHRQRYNIEGSSMNGVTPEIQPWKIKMKRYMIKIIYPSGTVAYMSNKGKNKWCYSNAKKHLNEFVLWHGLHAELEEI